MGVRTEAIAGNTLQWFSQWCTDHKPEDAATLFQGAWAIWKARNERLFNGNTLDPMQRAVMTLHE